jgi:uncharacterized membrane protein YeaQ/YmgE (transglycosylase-associated protein family)
MSKRATMTGMVVGSAVGSWLPSLWGAGFLSLSSIVGSIVGGLLGIWAAFRMFE